PRRNSGVRSFAASRRVGIMLARRALLYRPVRPEQLFLDESEWARRLGGRAVIQLSPFSAPGDMPDTIDAGARPAKDFAAERANPNVNLFEAVRDYLDEERKSGRHAAIAA